MIYQLTVNDRDAILSSSAINKIYQEMEAVIAKVKNSCSRSSPDSTAEVGRIFSELQNSFQFNRIKDEKVDQLMMTNTRLLVNENMLAKYLGIVNKSPSVIRCAAAHVQCYVYARFKMAVMNYELSNDYSYPMVLQEMHL